MFGTCEFMYANASSVRFHWISIGIWKMDYCSNKPWPVRTLIRAISLNSKRHVWQMDSQTVARTSPHLFHFMELQETYMINGLTNRGQYEPSFVQFHRTSRDIYEKWLNKPWPVRALICSISLNFDRNMKHGFTNRAPYEPSFVQCHWISRDIYEKWINKPWPVRALVCSMSSNFDWYILTYIYIYIYGDFSFDAGTALLPQRTSTQ